MSDDEKADLCLTIYNFLASHVRGDMVVAFPPSAPLGFVMVRTKTGTQDEATLRLAAECLGELVARKLAKQDSFGCYAATSSRRFAASTTTDPWAWVEA